MPKRGQTAPPARTGNDPVSRAQAAMQDLRDATRAGHEMIQGAKEVTRELAAAEQRVKDYAADLIPGEVARQLERLQPAIEAAVDKAVACAIEQFEKRIADVATAFAGAVEDAMRNADPRNKQSVTALVEGMSEGSCPHCGAIGDISKILAGVAHEEMPSGKPGKPKKGDVSRCAQCGGIAVFDHDPSGKLILRKPSKKEEGPMSKDRRLRQAFNRREGGDSE